MTIWVQRTFAYGSWGSVQDKFEELYLGQGGPANMMLISESAEDRQTEQLFAQLPDPAYANLLAGFEPISDERLPKIASLLVGNQTAFTERFNFPTKSNL